MKTIHIKIAIFQDDANHHQQKKFATKGNLKKVCQKFYSEPKHFPLDTRYWRRISSLKGKSSNFRSIFFIWSHRMKKYLGIGWQIHAP